MCGYSNEHTLNSKAHFSIAEAIVFLFGETVAETNSNQASNQGYIECRAIESINTWRVNSLYCKWASQILYLLLQVLEKKTGLPKEWKYANNVGKVYF